MSSLAMSRAQREEFLAATRVGVVSIADGNRGPLAVPVWYRYTPGGTLRFVTGASSGACVVPLHPGRPPALRHGRGLAKGRAAARRRPRRLLRAERDAAVPV